MLNAEVGTMSNIMDNKNRHSKSVYDKHLKMFCRILLWFVDDALGFIHISQIALV